MLTDLSARLRARENTGLYRRRLMLEGPQTTDVTVAGERYLAFCSNDYLGLANHPALVEAVREGAQQYGVGSGASHLISGHTSAHHALEEALAQFVGLPQALLFSTGYMANIAVVTTLVGRGDAVFVDKLNHASLNDAVLLSRASFTRYPHLELARLAQCLADTKARHKLVATDAVFSMDGDIAPTVELLALCERYDAWLLLDDAHGFGVLGRNGKGVLHAFDGLNLGSPHLVYMATLGKAAGVFGAFVAAQPDVIAALIQFARTYGYTTAAPPLLSHALLTSLSLLEQEAWRREKLTAHRLQLDRGLQSCRWSLLPSVTPIQPLMIGRSEEAVHLSERLRDKGIIVPAIRPPTIPQGQARLRISLSAAHDAEDIDRLIEALHDLANII